LRDAPESVVICARPALLLPQLQFHVASGRQLPERDEKQGREHLMKTWIMPSIVLAGMALAPMGPAVAQQRAQKPPGEITLINGRTVAVTAFEIATSGDNPRLVAKLAKPLGAGKSIKIKLNKPTGCSFFVLARFEDESENDSDGLNLCGEKQIRLTD
jgi:hypothetical protein